MKKISTRTLNKMLSKAVLDEEIHITGPKGVLDAHEVMGVIISALSIAIENRMLETGGATIPNLLCYIVTKYDKLEMHPVSSIKEEFAMTNGEMSNVRPCFVMPLWAITSVSNSLNVCPKSIQRIFRTMLGMIHTALCQGIQVVVTNVGTFNPYADKISRTFYAPSREFIVAGYPKIIAKVIKKEVSPRAFNTALTRDTVPMHFKLEDHINMDYRVKTLSVKK